MNTKTLILTSAFVMLASASQAADITSPFYLPKEGKMLSETSVEYNRLNTEGTNKGNKNEGWYAKETLSYGVSNKTSVFVAIGNTFDNTVNYEVDDYNNSHNFDYTVGMKHNQYFGDFATQFSVAYNTFQSNSFGLSSSTNWNKYVDLGVKIGYDNPCFDKTLIPYVAFNAIYGLNSVENTMLNYFNSPEQGHFTYVTYAGVYKAYDKISTDMGIRWENVRDRIGVNDRASRDDVYAQAEVNYKVSDDMSVGVYGDYIIGDSQMSAIDYGYTVGANLKVAF